MKTIRELKNEKQEKVNQHLTKCGVFFAFSNEQFEQGKTPLPEGDKYVSIGAGGYMPKTKVEEFKRGMKDIGTWYENAVKSNKARRANIIYELGNYECWYTYDLQPALNALGEGYTPAEVIEVFNAELDKKVF
jgi:hypothetical protein